MLSNVYNLCYWTNHKRKSCSPYNSRWESLYILRKSLISNNWLNSLIFTNFWVPKLIWRFRKFFSQVLSILNSGQKKLQKLYEILFNCVWKGTLFVALFCSDSKNYYFLYLSDSQNIVQLQLLWRVYIPSYCERFCCSNRGSYRNWHRFGFHFRKFCILCSHRFITLWFCISFTGVGGESIYGHPFEDEFHSRLRFSHRGIVAMATTGRNQNRSQFFITLDKTPELDRKHTIFGKVLLSITFSLHFHLSHNSHYWCDVMWCDVWSFRNLQWTKLNWSSTDHLLIVMVG